MKECIVLAGGLGTRLQSVVNEVPKCMAPINGIPFLSFLFNYLEEEQFSHVVLSLGYKAEIVIDWLKTEKRLFTISYVVEKKALGTGGAIKYAMQYVKSEQVFVFNGDTYFNVSTSTLNKFHELKQAKISLALKKMKNFSRYGTVERNEENRIVGFVEKQKVNEGNINGGVYLINKNIFENFEVDTFFSFEKEVLETRLKNLRIYGELFDNYFIDIGVPEDFSKMNEDFKLNS